MARDFGHGHLGAGRRSAPSRVKKLTARERLPWWSSEASRPWPTTAAAIASAHPCRPGAQLFWTQGCSVVKSAGHLFEGVGLLGPL